MQAKVRQAHDAGQRIPSIVDTSTGQKETPAIVVPAPRSRINGT